MIKSTEELKAQAVTIVLNSFDYLIHDIQDLPNRWDIARRAAAYYIHSREFTVLEMLKMGTVVDEDGTAKTATAISDMTEYHNLVLAHIESTTDEELEVANLIRL